MKPPGKPRKPRLAEWQRVAYALTWTAINVVIPLVAAVERLKSSGRGW